jgi:deazaflavin-dependent oxidoreductase (nitroreductase family)
MSDLAKGQLMFLWKLFMGLHVLLYRLTKGRFGGNFRGFKILLLTTVGRKTGLKRIVPLGYIMDGDAYVIIASNAGKESHPAWYLNLNTNSQAEIQVGDKVMTVHAETAAGEYRTKLWEQLLREAPAYGDYKTRREIPLVVLRA